MNVSSRPAVRERTNIVCDQGLDANVALQQLPADLRHLNQVYLDHVTQRTLLSASEAAAWLDQRVVVFLRHDKVRVFAVVSDSAVAMADFVTLSDTGFHVNAMGRTQSNAERGPLPNQRTVHAFLTGRLTAIADSGRRPNPEHWESVVYHPLATPDFVRAESGLSIQSSSLVKLVPGTQKVWCPRAQDQDSQRSAKDTPS